MKKILLILVICAGCRTIKAQGITDPNPPAPVTTGTMLPTQSGPPYDGANQSGTSTPGINIPPPPNLNVPTQPTINYTDPTNPAYPVNPNVTTPVTPTSNTGPKQYHRLFQDPMKTPRNPKQATHVGTVDGSGGKYASNHPVRKDNFNKHHKRLHLGKAPKTSKEKESKSFPETK